MPRITRTTIPAMPRAAVAETITPADQAAIMKLIDAEVAKGADRPAARSRGGMVAKYMVVRPDPGPVAKYMVRPPAPGPTPKYMVHPPGPGGGGGPIVAKYMVVPPDVVAKYMVVPPWAGIDAHQAVINKVTSNGKVSHTEAQLVRKLFNRDIAEAWKDGRDIRPQVQAYLHNALDGLKMDKTSKNLIFGVGGPGYKAPFVAKYMVVRPG